MSDVIWDITFNNFLIPTNVSAVISGTIEVNYSLGTIYTNSAHGANGLQITDMTGTYTFTSFAANNVHYDPSVNSNTVVVGNSPAVGGGGNFMFSISGVNPASPNFFVWQNFVTSNVTVYSGPFSADAVTAAQVCFASGARIRTPAGDVPVQALRAGDMVLTASGEPRRIKWVGRRRMRRAFGGRGHDTVRIAAHAFGDNRPCRDLVVSPTHSICVDILGEVLIPAARLVNGATITLETVDRVTWHHVELDSHDILLADNLPAESYLDMGNRRFFEEAGATLDSPEEGGSPSHADFCRRFVDGGPILAFVRERLLDRARRFGWTPRREANLRLFADGAILRPETRPGCAAFVFPADATDVRLVSDTFTPASLGGEDKRRLGVSIREFVISTGSGATRAIGAADQRLRDGVHAIERSGQACWRWTDGELILDPALWAGLEGPLTLIVAWDEGAVRGWNAPMAAASDGALAA